MQSRSQYIYLLLATLAITLTSQTQAQQPTWRNILRQPSEWYGSKEAIRIADNVLLYQHKNGGWGKNINMASELDETEKAKVVEKTKTTQTTIDNGASIIQINYLARVYNATQTKRFKDNALRGIDYILDAQYENGGWPQYYPIRKGYYQRITYNDGAMIGVMNILRNIAHKEEPYTFVDQPRQKRAETAVQKGIDCILKTQIMHNGKPTAWCAQHDELTLEPAWARAYEPPSLSGSESVGIVRFLMSIEKPTPEITQAIEGAVNWFQSVIIKNTRQDRIRRDDGRTERVLVPDPSAPPLWARFYELKTNRPLYLDRDSVFRYDYSEIGYERRSGYSYNGTWASSLLTEDYPAWRKKHNRP